MEKGFPADQRGHVFACCLHPATARFADMPQTVLVHGPGVGEPYSKGCKDVLNVGQIIFEILRMDLWRKMEVEI